MRSLYLHVSALNDDEYSLFTSSFTDLLAFDTPLTNDADFEKQKVSIREARAWLRGRYHDLPVSDLDQILRFFSPSPGQDAALTRGQFFAVLRLVLHVRGGAELDKNLVFKQVYLNSSPDEPTSPSRPVNDRPSRSFPAPPRRRQPSGGVFDAPTSDTNPFSLPPQVQEHPHPPVHPDLRPSTTSSPNIVPIKPPQILPAPTPPPVPVHHASNPFVARAAAAAARSNPSPERKPPLPPRKTPPLLPPRSTSILVTPPLTGPHSKPPPPPPPAKVPHLTTALMQQSLQASKAAKEAKRLEAQREQERVLQVLKSSSSRSISPPKRPGVGSASSRSSVDGSGPSRPLLPPRPRVSPPASVASARSFEQVAGATLLARAALRRSPSPIRARSESRPPRTPSPSGPTTDLPPPVHPNRKNSQSDSAVVGASPPRFGRSRSVHHHPSAPPVPQRRRPDSVQVLPSPRSGPSTPNYPTTLALAPKPSTAPPTSSPTFSRLSRHLSLSAREHPMPMPVWDDVRGTLSTVRYKAEAGISKRGWVPGLEREERLIAVNDDGGGGGGMSSSDDGLGVDAESPGEDERERERRRGPLERDEMKWPAGNGWKPLA